MSDDQSTNVSLTEAHFVGAAKGLFWGAANDPDLGTKAQYRAKAMCEADTHDVDEVILTTMAGLIYLISMDQVVNGTDEEAAP